MYVINYRSYNKKKINMTHHLTNRIYHANVSEVEQGFLNMLDNKDQTLYFKLALNPNVYEP